MKARGKYLRQRRRSGFASSTARRARGTLREQMAKAGRARFAKMTPEERSEYGRWLAAIRLAKQRARKAAEKGEPPPDDLVF